jgi:hypothetical protein
MRARRSPVMATGMAFAVLASCSDDANTRELERQLSDARVKAMTAESRLAAISEEVAILKRRLAELDGVQDKNKQISAELAEAQTLLAGYEAAMDELSKQLDDANAKLAAWEQRPAWERREAWAKLAVGLTKQDVIEILGLPPKFVNRDPMTGAIDPRDSKHFVWYYPEYRTGGTVEFLTDSGGASDRVSKWTLPPGLR